MQWAATPLPARCTEWRAWWVYIQSRSANITQVEEKKNDAFMSSIELKKKKKKRDAKEIEE